MSPPLATVFGGACAVALLVSLFQLARLKARLRQAESQLLREKLSTFGVVAGGIAHEIGTPLGVVRGRAEYIRGKLSGHSQVAGLDVIIEQIDFISGTLKRLLAFARTQPVVARAVPLLPVARAAAEQIRAEAESRQIDLSIRVAATLPPLNADPDALRQLLVHLMRNGCDACRPGGQVSLTAAVDARRGCLRIEVRDDGVGIAPEQRHQLFDPFFTTKKRGQGTGLGLTLCAQVVRDHQGEIEITSELGRGTLVAVRWPCGRGDKGVCPSAKQAS